MGGRLEQWIPECKQSQYEYHSRFSVLLRTHTIHPATCQGCCNYTSMSGVGPRQGFFFFLKLSQVVPILVRDESYQIISLLGVQGAGHRASPGSWLGMQG